MKQGKSSLYLLHADPCFKQILIIGRCLRFRQTDRTVELALVPRADVASLGAADAVLDGQHTDLTAVFFLLSGHFIFFSLSVSPFHPGPSH